MEHDRFESVGYIIDLENNDPEDDYQYKSTVNRCVGCRALVLDGDTEAHVCIADLIADEVRALRDATDSYVKSAVSSVVPDARHWAEAKRRSGDYEERREIAHRLAADERDRTRRTVRHGVDLLKAAGGA